MIYIPKYFSIDEFACPHVYDKYGERAWMFFDIRLLVTMFTLRDRIGKPIFSNNYLVHGNYTQRGLRCPQCQKPKEMALAGILYMSGHVLAKADDFDVQELSAEEVRQWIITHQNLLPYPVRLEKDVNWVHLDVFDEHEEKVYLFNK